MEEPPLDEELQAILDRRQKEREEKEARLKAKRDAADPTKFFGYAGALCFFVMAAAGGRVLGWEQQAYLALLGIILLLIDSWWTARAFGWTYYRFADHRNHVLIFGAVTYVFGKLYAWLLGWLFS